MTKREQAKLLEKAQHRFNKLMTELGLEHHIETDGDTIKHMTEFCKQQHDTYYEDGHVNSQLHKDQPVQWRSEKDRLWRFWNTYKKVQV